MRRLACTAVLALVAASGATAKEGAQAHLLAPLPKHPRPGTLITIRWSVDVPGSDGTRNGFNAVGMFVRVSGRRGSRLVYARETIGPPYSARVRVPAGGIRALRFGLMGSSAIYFPLK